MRGMRLYLRPSTRILLGIIAVIALILWATFPYWNLMPQQR